MGWVSTMCSKCKTVLIGFGIPHTVSQCPLGKLDYCSFCCERGHITEECIDAEIVENQGVAFVEQLISPSLRKQYGIDTKTPIPNGVTTKANRFEPVLEVEESEKAIRQILMNYGIQPSGRPKENRRLLKQIADDLGRKLLYIKPM